MGRNKVLGTQTTQEPTKSTTDAEVTKLNLKFGGDNCILDPRIAMTILEYDITNFRKFLCLSPAWHHLVLEGLEERMK